MTSPFGTLTIAGFTVREEWTASAAADGVSVAGQETSPPSAAGHVLATHHNMVGVNGSSVPVVFTAKPHLTGFYRVSSASSELFQREDVTRSTWQASLERLGAASDVEIESRVPTVGRGTDHAVSPVYWHAPAIGYSSYMTGTANPSSQLTRTSSDGAVTVHLGIPVAYAPRWTVDAVDYVSGGARLLFDGRRSLGAATPPHVAWEANNGLVRLASGASGAFDVACWDAGQWRSVKGWQVTVNGAALTGTPDVSVLRNEPEEVVVRLTYPTTPAGRVTVDLGLRRGSRFVTGVMKRNTAATLGVKRSVNEAGTSETGRIRATANDVDGNRYVIGSARTYTNDLTAGGISKASVTVLDFFVGHAVDGSAAVTGDTPGDLLGQYLGSAGGERAAVVRQ